MVISDVSTFTVVMVVLMVVTAPAIVALLQHLRRKREGTARGLLCRVQDGPDRGRLVAISLDGPVTVLRLVQPGDDESRKQEKP